MVSTTSFGDSNSGLQAAIINGNVTAQFLQSESLNQACLRDLRTTNPHDDKDRIQNTNGGLLKDSCCWILDNKEFKKWRNTQETRLLWIKGDPGKGKTMLLCGIIDELAQFNEGTSNISFFFCQATDVRINNATAVLRGLIYLLVEKQPCLLPHVRSRYDQAGKALFEDVNAWQALSGIFRDIMKDPSLKNAYLIIDALDECISGLRSLLDFVVQESSAHPQMKWIVSSRNWPEIEERFDLATHIAPISLELNEVSVSEAVAKFIQHKVHSLAKVKKYKHDIRDTICRHLLLNSQGTFLWVALVCGNLDRTPSRHAVKKLWAFPPGLNDLYGRMIDQVRKSDDSELCKQILAIMSTVFRPITLIELQSLIEVPHDDYNVHEFLPEVIAVCGSFLILREETITFVHQSAKEFLLREALSEILPEGIGAEHHMIFARSLRVMFSTLRRDIFKIKLPGLLIKDVERPSPNPLEALQYACVYWVDHLQVREYNESYELNLDEKDCVDTFLQQKYLYWLEALSIFGSISYGIKALQNLEMVFQEKDESQALLQRIQDASRFIRYHRTAIESSPLQVYYSPLIFSPTESLTRMSFQQERPEWVLNEPVAEKNWSECLHVLEGHTQQVNSVAWSPDGSRIASASCDKTIRIWDPTTGQCMSTLKGHIDRVSSIYWSQDKCRLASVSRDGTVRIWDTGTGHNVSTLGSHSKRIGAITWSPDGSRIASVSGVSAIRIWDPTTGQCLSMLKGHTDVVRSIAWSQDGSRLASASHDRTVRIWEPATGQCAFTLKGHSGLVILIAWSQDGNRLASASGDSTIRIWDPATGQCVSTLEGHSELVMLITWSQNEKWLATASEDETIKVWDAVNDNCVSTIELPRHWVNAMAWIQDGSRLASGSSDNTVRIWEPATGQCASILKGHGGPVMSIAWSQDVGRLASASSDKTLRIWDLAASKCAPTLEGHSDTVRLIAWSQNGGHLASGSEDQTIRIWDPATGRCTSVLKIRSSPVMSIAWSQDGQLASGFHDGMIMILDPATTNEFITLKGHTNLVNSIAWSHDGSRFTSASWDGTIRVWDPVTGQCMLNLKGHGGLVETISLSQDGSLLASGSSDTIVRIWNLTTGQCILSLKGHSDPVKSIAWSQDGSRLASWSLGSILRVWRPATGECEFSFPIYSSFIEFDKIQLDHLHTGIGTLDLGSSHLAPSAPHLPEPYGYGLSNDHSWITYHGVNLLWLPAEYRPASPSSFAIYGTSVAIGCSSGRVVFLTLSEYNPLFEHD